MNKSSNTKHGYTSMTVIIGNKNILSHRTVVHNSGIYRGNYTLEVYVYSVTHYFTFMLNMDLLCYQKEVNNKDKTACKTRVNRIAVLPQQVLD